MKHPAWAWERPATTIGGVALREDVVDLFSGAGGWCVAAHALGWAPLGVELDAAAVATRDAAGLRSLRADVASLRPSDFCPVRLLIGSPPCPGFSAAGKGLGRKDLERLVQLARTLRRGEPIPVDGWHDERSPLCLEPLRWILECEPEMVALEQVRAVAPLWAAMEERLEQLGYSAWSGVLRAEEYGVPQTRVRAFLIASRSGPVGPPASTHARYDPRRKMQGGLLPAPVTMAHALGWGLTEGPATSVTASGSRTGAPHPLDGGSGARERYRAARESGEWVERDGVAAGASTWEASRASEAEAATLQTFAAPFPFQGTRTQQFMQIGNAVPPLWAWHVLRAVGA